MDGMGFFSKASILLLLFLLNGCNLINVSVIEDIFFKQPEVITQEYIQKNSQKSFHIISINNGDEKLAFINNKKNFQADVYSFNDEFTYTIDNGKIIKTYGFQNNIDIKNFKNYLDNLPVIDGKEISASIKFSNPPTSYLNIFYKYRVFDYKTKKIPLNIRSDEHFKIDIVVEEEFDMPLIRWKGKNYYFFDSNKKILRTIQNIEPNGIVVDIKIY